MVVRALKLKDNFYDLPKLIEEKIEKLRMSMDKKECQDEPNAFEVLCAT